jgi:hypothetical protein
VRATKTSTANCDSGKQSPNRDSSKQLPETPDSAEPWAQAASKRCERSTARAGRCERLLDGHGGVHLNGDPCNGPTLQEVARDMRHHHDLASERKQVSTHERAALPAHRGHLDFQIEVHSQQRFMQIEAVVTARSCQRDVPHAVC